SPDEFQRLQPWIRLADRLGAIVSQMGAARIEAIGIRYYGALADDPAAKVLASSVAAGVLRRILSGGVSMVNASTAARERGIEIIESRSSRPRHFTSLVSVKLHTSGGERAGLRGPAPRLRARRPRGVLHGAGPSAGFALLPNP